MVCRVCNVTLPDNSKYCPKCGTKCDGGAIASHQDLTAQVFNYPLSADLPDPADQEVKRAAQEIAQIWPDWIVTEKLGEGSFGRVYKAKRSEIGSDFFSAIKIIQIPQNLSQFNSIRAETGLDIASTTAYFQSVVDDCVNEIKTMESLKGAPNIVNVEDYKVVANESAHSWTIYIRMEYLRDFLSFQEDHEIRESEAIKLGIDICNALEYCAKRDVLHRDIKPENIFVSDFGDYKLGDFGIARRLETGSVAMSQKGTYNYMAPEIFNGKKEYDSRSDIYSLGIVLYKLMNNGRLPFIDPTTDKISYQSIKEALDRRMGGETLSPPQNASAHFSKLILAACSFNYEDRFPSATDMKDALIAVQNGFPFSGVQSSNKELMHDIERVRQGRRRATDKTKTTPTEQAKPGQRDVATFGDATKKRAEKPPKNEARLKPFYEERRFVVAILLIVVVLASCVTAFLLLRHKSIKDFKTEILSGSSQEAVTKYQKLSKSGKAEADTFLKDYIESIESDYYAGQHSFEDASQMLIGLENFSSVQKDAVSALKRIQEDNQNELAFLNAKQFAETGAWQQAVELLSAIGDNYRRYDEVQTLKQACLESYHNEVLAQCEAFHDKGDFKKIFNALENAIGYNPDDIALAQKLRDYQEEFEEKTLSDAQALADDNKWDEAVSLLQDSQEYLESDTIAETIEEYQTTSIKTNAEALKASDGMAAAIKYLRKNSDNETAAKMLTEYENQFVTDALDQAEELADQKEYEAAKSVLSDASDLCSDSRLAERWNQYQTAGVLKQAEDIKNADGTRAALTYLREQQSSTENLQATISQYEDNFVQESLSAAEALAQSRKYEEAINLLKEASSVVTSTQFGERIALYQTKLPIDLADCRVLAKDDAVDVGENGEDNFGNEYKNAIIAHGNEYWPASITFYPNAEYVTLKGCIAPDDISGRRTVEIYLDGNLVYTSPDMYNTTEPITFEIDISGCKQIRLYFEFTKYGSGSRRPALIFAAKLS